MQFLRRRIWLHKAIFWTSGKGYAVSASRVSRPVNSTPIWQHYVSDKLTLLSATPSGHLATARASDSCLELNYVRIINFIIITFKL